MRLTEFYSSIGWEYLKLYAKVYNKTSRKEYNVFLELDDDTNKLFDFSCTCKYCTILMEQHNKVTKKCKHIQFLIDTLNKSGWEIKNE